MKLIFATNNQHKVDEILAVLVNHPSIEIITLKQQGVDLEIPEPFDTLEDNATHKSQTIYRLTAMDCFSEDTGLEVAALNGEPGVKTARYAGEERSPEKNMDKLLAALAHLSDRTARFRTVISLILQGKEVLFDGICKGRIAKTKTGEGGFGYDAVFVPDGANRSFAEMTMREKNIYSHRRKAIEKLADYLAKAHLSLQKNTSKN